MLKWLSVVVVAVFLEGFQPGALLEMPVAGLPSQPHFGAGEIDASSSAQPSVSSIGGNPVAEDRGGSIDLDQLCLASETVAAPKGCCSNHGGVCGCKGGQDLCCDKTLSPSCTCHTASKSGCCSRHGGICGCKGGKDLCCDKTLSLSCTC
jgi:hypothetical protein